MCDAEIEGAVPEGHTNGDPSVRFCCRTESDRVCGEKAETQKETPVELSLSSQASEMKAPSLSAAGSWIERRYSGVVAERRL